MRTVHWTPPTTGRGVGGGPERAPPLSCLGAAQAGEERPETHNRQGREEVDEQGPPGKDEGYERQYETRVGLAPAGMGVVEDAGDEGGQLQEGIDWMRPERQQAVPDPVMSDADVTRLSRGRCRCSETGSTPKQARPPR